MHVIDIQQGTIITPEMVSQLKPGMTRSQVQFVMGTPTIADPFHHERWDYVYTLEERKKPLERHHVVLFFDEEDRLERIEERAPPTPR
jgi:outer membrane protein assembly factor BamE